MTLRNLIVLLILGALLVSGCAKKSVDGSAPALGPQGLAPDAGDKPAEKIKVTAYINVSSGCQASTVELVNNLGVEYVDLVDLEIVNFGSPEGHRRWLDDGMECMGILFDNGNGPSPALKFKDRDGNEKTVVFFMPAGFSWEHKDLEDAFAALKAGELTILSEDEAKEEVATKTLDVTVAIKDTEDGSQILVANEPVFTVMASQDDATAADRANDAKAAIEKWLAKPVQPSDIQVSAKDGAVTIMGGHVEIITVTAEDAQEASAENARALAMEWAEGLKKVIVNCALDE